ncbi:MAG: hypothetical protein KGZ31_05215 [Sulfuritalea sp.]|nr:hypothetical protein [Sulfuritalea sp.]
MPALDGDLVAAGRFGGGFAAAVLPVDDLIAFLPDLSDVVLLRGGIANSFRGTSATFFLLLCKHLTPGP